MKTRACILIFIWSALLLEPISANLDIATIYSSCTVQQEAKTSCSKSTCDKPADKEEENDCEGNRCNPVMSCPTGNFYMSGHTHLSIATINQANEKSALIDDNRIVKQIADCWHPPETV